MSNEIRPNYYKTQARVKLDNGTEITAAVECFDIIDALDLDFYVANALKYIWRMGKKDDGCGEVADIQKAITYLQQAHARRALPF